MKIITLVRHAKSSWDNPDWSDLERPLNKRGLADAPFLADKISKKKNKPEKIYSSPANRALTTAKEYAKAFDYKLDDIIVEKGIYDYGKRHIINIIKALDNEINDVMFFGHNPDITSLSSYFSGEFFDNVPTCGTLCVEFDCNNWEEVTNINGKIVFYEFPKKYSKKERSGFTD